MPTTLTVTVHDAQGNPVVGRTVRLIPMFINVEVKQSDTVYADMSEPYVKTTTNSSGVATVTMPRLDEVDYSGTVFYIDVEDLATYKGPPINQNTRTLYQLRTIDGWTLAQ